MKAYYDLSNNLSILSDSSTTAQNAAAQVAGIQITLQGIYNTMCKSTGSASSSAACTTMNTQLNALQTNINSGSSFVTSKFSGSSSPIQIAIQSRNNLVTQMNTFQCTRINPDTPTT